MGRDWESLAGEKGAKVPSGRWGRLYRVGKLGLSVASSAAGHAVRRRFSKDTDEGTSIFHTKQAQKILETLGQMKGAAMKVGQILSTDPDAVPAEFADILTQLQKDAPSMTYLAVKSQIEGALQQSIEDVFHTFQPEPIGSASIGQVHRGTLHDGRDVAIKVQYPGVVESIESDLRNLTSLLVLARPLVDKDRLSNLVEECRDSLLAEANYEAEAANLERFQELLKDRPGVCAPAPVMELCRRDLLVMEYVEGTKLDDKLESLVDRDERRELAQHWMQTYIWMCHELFELHSDPHPGNFLVRDNGDLVFLDFGAVKTLSPHYMDGLLRIVRACMKQDYVRVREIMAELGFGGRKIDPGNIPLERIQTYFGLMLEPFLHDGPFDFGKWELHSPMRRLLLRHPDMLKATPPAELLMPARVMGGVKGLLTRFEIELNVHQMTKVVIEKRLGTVYG